MASCGTYFLFLILICITIAGCDFNFVNLKCNSDNHGRFGHQSLLKCIVNLSQEAQDAQITRVFWMKGGAETALIEYNSKTTSGDDLKRFTFAEPEWNGRNMNVSMLVKNTRIADIGNYMCLVITNRGECRTSTSLSVSAPYGTPTISMTQNNQNVAMTLSCSARGGYPEGRIFWFDEHKSNWTSSSKQNAVKTEDGRFDLISKLELLPGSIFSKYTCVVHNSSGGREGEAQYNITTSSLQKSPKQEGSRQESGLASKIIIPVVIVGAVIIGLLMVRLLNRNCKSSHQALPANNEYHFEGEHQQPTEPCTEPCAHPVHIPCTHV